MLEIGCGEGFALRYLRRFFRPGRLLALDLDIRMVQRAAGRGQAPVAVGDAAFLPVRRRSMDAVFAFGVLHHVTAWQQALSGIAAILRQGGVFCFEEFYPALYQNVITRHLLVHPETNRFRSRELHARMKAAGLVIRQQIELRPFYILGAAVKR